MLESRFLKHIQQYGETIAIIVDSQSFSFNQLCDEAANRKTDWEATTIVSENIVAIKAEPTFLFFVNLLALSECGAVIVPYVEEKQLQESGLNEFIEYSIDENKLIKKQSLPNGLETKMVGRAGLILQTSGSSGKPKLILHQADFIFEKYLKLKQKFTSVLVYSLDHVSGLETSLSVLSPGGTIVCIKSIQPKEVAELIQKHQADLLSCSPSFLRLLLFSGYFSDEYLGSLSKINFGAEKMPEKLLQELVKQLPTIQFSQAFGTTETSNIRTETQAGSEWFKPGIEYVDFRVVEGNLCLKKPTSWLGYLNIKDEKLKLQPAPDWYATGDLVEQNPESFIRILSREHEYINVGGEKVHPSEVEAIILEMENVADVLVHKETNALLGEIVVAKIFPKVYPENEVTFKQKVREHCRLSLPEHKVPQKITLLKEPLLTIRLKRG